MKGFCPFTKRGKMSSKGYKKNSPDVDNDYNVIPSGDITMKDVEFDVVGTDNLGNTKLMKPGKNYKFPGDMVFEKPATKKNTSKDKYGI